MNAKNFKFSLKSILSLFFICRVGMHENILHHFLFKNFIFLGPLVRDLVRDIVLSSFLTIDSTIQGKRIDIWNVLKCIITYISIFFIENNHPFLFIFIIYFVSFHSS